MNAVLPRPAPVPAPIPGVDHATWASRDDGLSQLSVWRQRLQPGASTPPHAHDCDEVVLCEGGSGELHADGAVRTFGAGETLVLPRGGVHRIVSVGPGALELVAVFGATPVRTRLPDGTALDLPWRS